jgi:MFS family permease
MLGMLTASLNLMLIAPVMPAIAADLGAIEHFSWLALSSMLSSTIAMPIAGKLSDSFGRKPFYILGIVLIGGGCVLCGLAPSFGFLLAARVIQGLGIGTVMTLSFTIIGDIISPLQRGKYQGIIGVVYGTAALLGPLAGGFLAQQFSWRWLFFLNVPLCLVAWRIIQKHLHLAPRGGAGPVDFLGIAALSAALVSFLVATDMMRGGPTWRDPRVLGLYAVAVIVGGLFISIEKRAVEPIMPLRLWLQPVFTFGALASAGVTICMYSATYFIPMFIQGVQGAGTAHSGMILLAQSLTAILAGVLGGQLISRYGHYKTLILWALASMSLGYLLMTLMGSHTTSVVVVRNLVLLGLGLGVTVPTFRLVIQNSATAADMGVTTATIELSRSVAAAAAMGIMGSLMTQRLQTDIAQFLPAGTLASVHSGPHMGAGAAFDPVLLSHLPPAVVGALRERLAVALRPVFFANLLCALAAFAATTFIRELPLRRTANIAVRNPA